VSGSFDPAEWTDFAVAVSGAAAALAGLLVVSISINVREIASDRTLPPRAAAALVMLVTPLVAAVCVLVPNQSQNALGVELVVAGATSGALLTALSWPKFRSAARSRTVWLMGQVMPAVLVSVPLIVAGIGLLTSGLGGLYWLPVSVIAAVYGGLMQAWGLLIEILR
jgi:modulator of FtsH protease